MLTDELPTTITIDDASEILGVSTRTAYRAAARNQIPTFRIGRRLFVPTRPLLDMLGLSPAEGAELLRQSEVEPA
jgi:excisionase family DNA binding protein